MMRRRNVVLGVFLVSVIVSGGVAYAERTLLGVREDVASRSANSRTWLYEYELTDPLHPEDVFTCTSRVLEKGTNMNRVSGYGPGGRPLWSPTVTDFVEAAGDYAWKVETGPVKVYMVQGEGGRGIGSAMSMQVR